MSTQKSFLGTLGDRNGVNVARVEVGWYFDGSTEWHTGYYLVHATGEEPEAQGEEGTIYTVFEDLVHAAMERRQERLNFDGWEIEDTSAA